MKESSFQTNVKHYLEDNGAYVINVWGGGFQSVGIPDLVICYNGVFVALELKVGYNKASERQIYNLERINKSGGIGIVFYHSKNWKEELNAILSALNGVANQPIKSLKETLLLPERHITKTTTSL